MYILDCFGIFRQGASVAMWQLLPHRLAKPVQINLKIYIY